MNNNDVFAGCEDKTIISVKISPTFLHHFESKFRNDPPFTDKKI